MLQSNLYITIIGDNITQVAFVDCALFTKCITKIYGITIRDAEEFDLVMPMYNPLEYSSKYSDTTSSSWFYSKDEATNFDNYAFRSFTYKAKSLRYTAADVSNGILRNTAIDVPLRYLNNFWISREMTLIKC